MAAPLILHVFPTFAVGGAQARFCSIANRLGPAFRHVVLAMDGVIACRERLSPGLDVSFPELPLRKGTVFGNVPKISGFLRRLSPDVLVTSNFGSIEFAMAARAHGRLRHIHMEDGFGPDERLAQRPRRVWTRRLVLRGSAVLLPSRTLLGLARDVWRLPGRRLHYVPNGVDLARFARRSGSPDPFTVGTVAALRPEKNLSRLLEAVAGVPGLRLIVVGDGPERAMLTARAGSLGIAGRVAFAGHLADPAPLYARLDAFALSSDTEQMPLSVLEAMASGLPVCATDVGDIRTMVAPENQSFVTALSNPDGLRASLAALCADPARRHLVGEANRGRAETMFDEDLMIRRHRALWDGQPVP